VGCERLHAPYLDDSHRFERHQTAAICASVPMCARVATVTHSHSTPVWVVVADLAAHRPDFCPSLAGGTFGNYEANGGQLVFGGAGTIQNGTYLLAVHVRLINLSLGVGAGLFFHFLARPGARGKLERMYIMYIYICIYIHTHIYGFVYTCIYLYMYQWYTSMFAMQVAAPHTHTQMRPIHHDADDEGHEQRS
jgi:hypothetical protein